MEDFRRKAKRLFFFFPLDLEGATLTDTGTLSINAFSSRSTSSAFFPTVL